jgi:hypothetical protein
MHHRHHVSQESIEDSFEVVDRARVKPMNILIMTIGSRGDLQPCIACDLRLISFSPSDHSFSCVPGSGAHEARTQCALGWIRVLPSVCRAVRVHAGTVLLRSL